jgi:hypothetical protein
MALSEVVYNHQRSKKYQLYRPWSTFLVREPVPLIQVPGPDTACDGFVGLAVSPEDGGDFAPVVVILVDTIQVLDMQVKKNINISVIDYESYPVLFDCVIVFHLSTPPPHLATPTSHKATPPLRPTCS